METRTKEEKPKVIPIEGWAKPFAESLRKQKIEIDRLTFDMRNNINLFREMMEANGIQIDDYVLENLDVGWVLKEEQSSPGDSDGESGPPSES